MKFVTLKNSFFFFTLFAVTGVFFWMLGSYLYAVLWAVVLAIIFTPLYRKIEQLFGGRSSIASLATLLVIAIVVMVPLFVVGTLLVQEATNIYRAYEGSSETSMVTDATGSMLIEQVSTAISRIGLLDVSSAEVQTRLEAEFARVADVLASSIISAGKTTFSFIIQLVITVYLLFFMLRDGDKLRQILFNYIPLSRKDEKRLIDRFVNASQAVVQGSILVGIIQGTVAGTALWIAGVSAPVLWGAVVTILSVMPVVGSFLVWFPIGVSMLVAGSIWEGLFVLGTGVFLVAVVDDFLRPILVGRKAEMNNGIVLLSMFGGLASFGITGFIIGPIMAALFISLWMIFEEKYRTQLRKK